jgi:hypothetical protein
VVPKAASAPPFLPTKQKTPGDSPEVFLVELQPLTQPLACPPRAERQAEP